MSEPSPYYALALAKHPPRAGDRVLDVGCGPFVTAFELARLVGTKGMVVGLDGCAVSFAGNARAARISAPVNLSVAHGDLRTYRFEHAFDRAFARLMTGCFSDPRPALTSLRTALRPGGWLVMLASVPGSEGPCGPSPFASADPEVLRAIAAGAGFGDVAIDKTVAPRGLGQLPSTWCLTARSRP